MDSILSEDASFIYLDQEETAETGTPHIPLSASTQSKSGQPEQSGRFKCDICQKLFTRTDNLQRHMRCHSDKNVRCSICSAFFPTKEVLHQHKRQHTDKLCNVCGAKFKKLNHLKEHIRTVHRTGPNEYACPVTGCNKSFTRKKVLRNHINVHANSKPYGCSNCQQSFSSAYAHSRHEARCKNPVKYSCKRCKKEFLSKEALKEHKDTVHHNTSFRCSCGKKFAWRSGLARHKKLCI